MLVRNNGNNQNATNMFNLSVSIIESNGGIGSSLCPTRNELVIRFNHHGGITNGSTQNTTNNGKVWAMEHRNEHKQVEHQQWGRSLPSECNNGNNEQLTSNGSTAMPNGVRITEQQKRQMVVTPVQSVNRRRRMVLVTPRTPGPVVWNWPGRVVNRQWKILRYPRGMRTLVTVTNLGNQP